MGRPKPILGTTPQCIVVCMHWALFAMPDHPLEGTHSIYFENFMRTKLTWQSTANFFTKCTEEPTHKLWRAFQRAVHWYLKHSFYTHVVHFTTENIAGVYLIVNKLDNKNYAKPIASWGKHGTLLYSKDSAVHSLLQPCPTGKNLLARKKHCTEFIPQSSLI